MCVFECTCVYTVYMRISPGGEHGNPHHILAWRIPWTEEPGGLYSLWGWEESDVTERLTTTHIHTDFHYSQSFGFIKPLQTPNDANSELLVLEEIQACVSQSLRFHFPLLISTQSCGQLDTLFNVNYCFMSRWR